MNIKSQDKIECLINIIDILRASDKCTNLEMNVMKDLLTEQERIRFKEIQLENKNR